VQDRSHAPLGPVSRTLIELGFADQGDFQVAGQVQGEAEASSAGANDEHIMLVKGCHKALCLPRQEVKYIMRVKDLAFFAPLRSSIYELAANKETPCCGTLSISPPLIAGNLVATANLPRAALSIYARAGKTAGQ
jgi:hypothetical protein